MPPSAKEETQHARAKSTKKLGLIPGGPRPTPRKLVLETPSNFSPPRERGSKYSTNFLVAKGGGKGKITNLALRPGPENAKRLTMQSDAPARGSQ